MVHSTVSSFYYAPEIRRETRLTDFIGFERIHCITFGTPPISLLPLTKPVTRRYHKSLFLSFVNEGDPVPRADKAYVRSLLNLFTSLAPGASGALSILPYVPKAKFGLKLPRRLKPPKTSDTSPTLVPPTWIWKVPPGALSNAGRLVVLRAQSHGTTAGRGDEENVRAEITTDSELREVVFG